MKIQTVKSIDVTSVRALSVKSVLILKKKFFLALQNLKAETAMLFFFLNIKSCLRN